MTSAKSLQADLLDQDARRWLLNTILTETTNACTAYLALRSGFQPLPLLNLDEPVKELSEVVTDMLMGQGLRMTGSTLRDSLSIRIQVDSGLVHQRQFWFQGMATLSGTALQTANSISLSFGGPVPMKLPITRGTALMSPSATLVLKLPARGPDKDTPHQGSHEGQSLRHAAGETSELSSVRVVGQYERIRGTLWEPHLLNQRFSSTSKGSWRAYIRMACYDCTLRALSELPDLERLRYRANDDLRRSAISRYIYDRNRRSTIDKALSRVKSYLDGIPEDQLDTATIVAQPCPKSGWDNPGGEYGGLGVRRRQCAVWVGVDGTGLESACMPKSKKEFTLTIKLSGALDLLLPLL